MGLLRHRGIKVEACWWQKILSSLLFTLFRISFCIFKPEMKKKRKKEPLKSLLMLNSNMFLGWCKPCETSNCAHIVMSHESVHWRKGFVTGCSRCHGMNLNTWTCHASNSVFTQLRPVFQCDGREPGCDSIIAVVSDQRWMLRRRCRKGANHNSSSAGSFSCYMRT